MMLTMANRVILLVFLLAFQPCLGRKRKDNNPKSRSLRVMNHSGVKIDVFWIHPDTRELAKSNTDGEGIEFGGETGISSFVGHSFEVQELPDAKTGKCSKGMCQKAYFTVSANEDQWFTIDKKFVVQMEDHKTRAMQKAKLALKNCTVDSTLPAMEQIDKLAACMEQRLDDEIKKTADEISFQASVRKNMGNKLVNYVCQDGNLTTTTPTHNVSWTYIDGNSRTYHNVKVLFEAEHSSVSLIEDFIDPSECQAVVKASAKGKEVSKDRYLMLKHKQGVAANVVAKVKSLAEAFLKVSIPLETDPLLNVTIQTVGDQQCTMKEQGKSCTASDTALNLVNAKNDTIATLILVCEAPKVGGGIQFVKTGVHVSPTEVVGEALLVVYQDAKLKLKEEDPYLNEYAICPVQEGSMTLLQRNF